MRRNPSLEVRNIFYRKCHVLYAIALALTSVCAFNSRLARAQTFEPPLPSPPAATAETAAASNVSAANSAAPTRIARPAGAPNPGWVDILATDQDLDPPWRHLRGGVRIEMTDMRLSADKIDFNNDTGDAYAQGRVHYENFVTGEILDCDHAEYNVDSQTGTFYNVRGTSPAKIQSRPGLLTTTNPFYFEGEWARREQQKYVIYRGFVTDCTMPRPWWRLTGPKFDIIPGERAIAYRSMFRVRRLPLFFAPMYYKSLVQNPRQSGFLSPTMGHSSLLGFMIGWGYYWAISPSYDLLYEAREYSIRGLAHTAGFRAKPREGTDFTFGLYALNDKGIPEPNGQRLKEGGFYITGQGESDLGDGWTARGNLDYLSSFVFRQNFTMSFTQAIFSESHSTALLTKHWSDQGLTFVADRVQDFDFDGSNPDRSVITRKLPEADYTVREKQIANLPFWFSLDSSAGFLDRSQPQFNTPAGLQTISLVTPVFMPRMDIYPHLDSSLHLGGFTFLPSFSIRETEFSDTESPAGALLGASLLRSAREFSLDILPPSLARIFDGPKWLGPKIKHVIEPRIRYHWVDGIGSDPLNLIRFDDTELMNDTNEVKVSLTNRLYVKRKDNNVDEVLTWEVSQIRYFDPTFGGAVLSGQRNVIWSSSELTPFAFISGPRSYSPVSSILSFRKNVGVFWRTDYDPKRPGFVYSELSADYHFLGIWGVNLGHTTMREDPYNFPIPVLSPSSNQLHGTISMGNQNRRGWNAGFNWFYDVKQGLMNFMMSQVTYNTDCCGFSGEFRHFDFGTRYDNQYLFSITIANVGGVGNLRREERVF